MAGVEIENKGDEFEQLRLDSDQVLYLGENDFTWEISRVISSEKPHPLSVMEALDHAGPEWVEYVLTRTALVINTEMAEWIQIPDKLLSLSTELMRTKSILQRAA